MKSWKKIFSAGCILASATPCLAQQRPNIVFIYADDMGYSDLGCYDSPFNDTPNLDLMASEGMRFTDFYASSSVSTPSRAGLLTGRYASRLGIRHVFMPYSFTGMAPEEVTLAEVLKPCGYSTALFGKWHLGSDYQYLPKRQGFDEFFGTACSIDNGPFVYIDGDRAQNRLAAKDSTTITYTRKACDFIERHREDPFFLYVAYNMPHVPLAASEAFLGKSRNGLYGDVVMELDWGVGEILRKLKEAGLDENTIVCFSSDNGPWLHEGPFGGRALPCYNGKGTTWDGGQRVPMIVRWPGHIKAGQTEESLACMLDWYVTFAKMAGASLPEDRAIDGYDISGVLLGTSSRASQDFAYIASTPASGDLSAYRWGDWKLKLPEAEVRGNFWEADEPAHDTLLFNLRRDIGERVNLKDKYPEIVKTICHKIDSLRSTKGFAADSVFQWDFDTDALTAGQRAANVLEAARKGVKPKSRNGALQLENFKLQEKISKAGGSTF